jgi:hypothetical protein
MAVAILLFVLLVGPLAVLYGRDTRILDPRSDRRGWFPLAPRR